MALEDGARVDFGRMRAARRERLLAEMERRGVDVLILGRDANARYATGSRRLFLAGTRPFGPGCIVVRRTGQVHLIGTWDDGIPSEIPRANLFGITWNPMNYLGWIKSIDGVAGAARVGVDGMSPLFGQLLPMALEGAEIVPAHDLVHAARRIKTPDEIACIRTAIAIAEAALAGAIERLVPGVRERDLLAAFEQRMTAYGVTVPAVEGTFCVTPREANGDGAPPLRRLTTDAAIGEGDLVAMEGGVLYAGYEGSVARTWPCPATASIAASQRRLHERWRAVWESVREACRPGATGADLRKAYEAAGEPLPPFPIVRGVGLGYEPPVVGTALGPDADARWVLEPGMTLAVGAYAWERGAGGYLGQEIVLVTADGPEVLTRLSHGPLAG
jgi:Xaa-Pro aminopeptidase